MCAGIIILVLMLGIIVDIIIHADGFIFLFSLVGIFVSTTIGTDYQIEFDHNKTTEIYSSSGGQYNQLSGSFCLVSGVFSSKEQYAVSVKNGEYFDRLYIPVATTHRVVNPKLKDKAIYTERYCRYKEKLFDIIPCSEEVRECPEKNILEVPPGAIIKTMQFN